MLQANQILIKEVIEFTKFNDFMLIDQNEVQAAGLALEFTAIKLHPQEQILFIAASIHDSQRGRIIYLVNTSTSNRPTLLQTVGLPDQSAAAFRSSLGLQTLFTQNLEKPG